MGECSVAGFSANGKTGTACDINWSRSVAEIDTELYKKYGLSPKEISFIESKVREMREERRTVKEN